MIVAIKSTAYPNGKVKHHKNGMKVEKTKMSPTTKYNKWIKSICVELKTQ